MTAFFGLSAFLADFAFLAGAAEDFGADVVDALGAVAVEAFVAVPTADLAAAYERADLGGVREVIIRHTAHAKATQQRGIERAGGQL